MNNLNNDLKLSAQEASDSCAISLESFQELAQKKDLVAISCGHKFSKIAISEWLAKEKTCPVCRKDVEKEKFIAVTLAVDEVSKSISKAEALENNQKNKKIPVLVNVNNGLLDEEALQAAINASKQDSGSASSSLSPSSSSSSSSKKKEKVEDSKPHDISSYKSFREIEHPNLPHEGIELLSSRVAAVDDNINVPYTAIQDRILGSAMFYLRAAFVLRITKEDGIWDADAIIEKLKKLIEEVQLLEKSNPVSKTKYIENYPCIQSLKYYINIIERVKNDKRINPWSMQILVERESDTSILWKYVNPKDQPKIRRLKEISVSLKVLDLEKKLSNYNCRPGLFVRDGGIFLEFRK